MIFGNCFDIFYDKIALDNLLEKPSSKNAKALFWFTAIIGKCTLSFNDVLLSGNYSFSKAIINIILNTVFYYILTISYKTRLSHRLLVILLLLLLNGTGETLAICLFIRNEVGKGNANDTFFTDSVGSMTGQIIAFFLLTVFISFWKRRIKEYPIQYHIAILFIPVISLSLLFPIDTIAMNYPESILPISIICGLLLINIINFYLLEYMLKAQQLSVQKDQLEKQTQMQQKHFDTLSTAYRSTRRIIHDTKKHALYIRSGIEQGKGLELLDSIDHFVGDLENSYIKTNTGSLPIDALVGYYSSITDDAGISFAHILSIDRFRLSKLPDYDMCIILGNLLENAYNAGLLITDRHSAYINLTISTERDKLFIQVINSCIRSKTPADNHYGEHGYGLKNIKNTVHKWNGQFTYCYVDHKTFRADVIIPLPLEQNFT